MTQSLDFKSEVAVAEEWVDELMRRLGWRDRDRVGMALIAALHALRDALPRDEAVFVGAQLPALLRGYYYEGWHFAGRGTAKGRDPFLERIRDGLHHDIAVDAEEVARAVMALLASHMPPAELEDAKAATPKALHYLWPA